MMSVIRPVAVNSVFHFDGDAFEQLFQKSPLPWISRSSLDASVASNRSYSSFYSTGDFVKPSDKAEIFQRLKRNKYPTSKSNSCSVDTNFVVSNESVTSAPRNPHRLQSHETSLGSSFILPVDNTATNKSLSDDESLSTNIGNSYLDNTKALHTAGINKTSKQTILEKDNYSLLEADTVTIGNSTTENANYNTDIDRINNSTFSEHEDDQETTNIVSFKPHKETAHHEILAKDTYTSCNEYLEETKESTFINTETLTVIPQMHPVVQEVNMDTGVVESIQRDSHTRQKNHRKLRNSVNNRGTEPPLEASENQRKKPSPLHLWIIKPIHHCQKICVEGKRSLADEEFWHSGVVAKRISKNIVETCSGSQYQLIGCIQRSDAVVAGVPKDTVTKFRSGFPLKWKELVHSMFQSEKTAADEPCDNLDSDSGLHHKSLCEDKSSAVVMTRILQKDVETVDFIDDRKQNRCSPVSTQNTNNEYFLTYWTILPLPNCAGIYVEGKKSDCEGEREFWHSNAIETRITKRKILSVSGSIYNLVGHMNIGAALDAGFSMAFVTLFTRGFPISWQDILKEFYALQTSKSHLGAGALVTPQRQTGSTESKEEVANEVCINYDDVSSQYIIPRSSEDNHIQLIKYRLGPEPNYEIHLRLKHSMSTPTGQIVHLDSLKKTRSGRLVKPVLAWWAGQNVVMDSETGGLEVSYRSTEARAFFQDCTEKIKSISTNKRNLGPKVKAKKLAKSFSVGYDDAENRPGISNQCKSFSSSQKVKNDKILQQPPSKLKTSLKAASTAAKPDHTVEDADKNIDLDVKKNLKSSKRYSSKVLSETSSSDNDEKHVRRRSKRNRTRVKALPPVNDDTDTEADMDYDDAENRPGISNQCKSFSSSQKVKNDKILQQLPSKLKTSLKAASTAAKPDHTVEDADKNIDLDVKKNLKSSKRYSSKVLSETSSSDNDEKHVRRRSKRNRTRVKALPPVNDDTDTEADMDYDDAENRPGISNQCKSFSSSQEVKNDKILQQLPSKLKTSLKAASTAAKPDHTVEDADKNIDLDVKKNLKSSKRYSSKVLSETSSSDNDEEHVRQCSKRNRTFVKALPPVSDDTDTEADMDYDDAKNRPGISNQCKSFSSSQKVKNDKILQQLPSKLKTSLKAASTAAKPDHTVEDADKNIDVDVKKLKSSKRYSSKVLSETSSSDNDEEHVRQRSKRNRTFVKALPPVSDDTDTEADMDYDDAKNRPGISNQCKSFSASQKVKNDKILQQLPSKLKTSLKAASTAAKPDHTVEDADKNIDVDVKKNLKSSKRYSSKVLSETSSSDNDEEHVRQRSKRNRTFVKALPPVSDDTDTEADMDYDDAKNRPGISNQCKSFSASQKVKNDKILQQLPSKLKTSLKAVSTAAKPDHTVEDADKNIDLDVKNNLKNSKRYSSKVLSETLSSSDNDEEHVRRHSKRNRTRVKALPPVSDNTDTEADMDVKTQILSVVKKHNAQHKQRKPKQRPTCYNPQPWVITTSHIENDTSKRLTRQDSNRVKTAKKKECDENMKMKTKKNNEKTVMTSKCKRTALNKNTASISGSYTMSDSEESNVIVEQDRKAVMKCTNRKLHKVIDIKSSPKPWTKTELSLLYKAVQSIKGDEPDYWECVAAKLNGRATEECKQAYIKEIPDKRKKVKTAAKTKSGRAPVLLTAKVGTLKRKQQLRDFINQQNTGYKDDLFSSTPFRTKSNKVTQNNLDDETDSIFDELAKKNPIPLSKFHTPNSRFYIAPVSGKKTPASSLISPWSTMNRKDVDQLVREIQLKRRRIVKSQNKQTKVAHSESLKAVPEEALVKSLFGSSPHAQFDLNRLFASDQSVDQHDDDDEEKDYYWSDQMEEEDN